MRHPYRHHHAHQDHVRRPDEHATVKATLANWTDGAVLLTSDKIVVPVWVPRRALDPASQALIFRTGRGAEIEIRVSLKLALDKGLV